ncbi:hypothetical protein GCG54_00008709 [Colletotrichum gloeosporioides]|uniref:Tat pathway signal sequence n=1 Tax=Colletotrichum gloeosporioides TaxID=474922 RepID=A0A8H4CNV5_COLGL|nr:uncharacterized protein GCG54_00008709 [Colletotrichum gloeosporioides]KAF3807254.1 hypothetical protein GCG54_00008709 [Colletotrichum gloeosporioides]
MTRILTLEQKRRHSPAATGSSRSATSEPSLRTSLSPQESIFSNPAPVIFPTRYPSVATSTASLGSSTPVFTPESSRSPSINRNDPFLFPELRFPSDVSPDEPLPSVETATWAEFPSGALTPSSPTTRARVPSLSISPSPSILLSPRFYRAADNVSGRLSLAQNFSETGSLAHRLDRLVIDDLDKAPSDLGLSDIRAGLSNLFINNGRRSPHLSSPAPSIRQSSSSPRPLRRSRAGSEVPLVYYDVKDEELPESRFYNPAVQSAIKDAKALMTRLVSTLEGSPLHISPDSTIKRLHGQALHLSHFQGPSMRTIGFVGDSGVDLGKSSVLNSLLDKRHLARTSNSGAACTCVVTEYHYADGHDFAIEVELFSQDDLMEQTKELLQLYRLSHLNEGEIMGNDGAAAAVDNEEQANVARDTFRSMFRGRLASEDFLLNESENTVLETFRSWLREIDLPVGGRHEKASQDDCAGFLAYLTSESTDTRTPAVWPFVRKIKVFLSSHILSKGLILVDLPGLRDSNSARRLITEKYLVKCDEIFAICNIGRATTDVGVQSVFGLAQKAGLSNVRIICTKSDDIQAEEAMKDWQERHATRIQLLSDAVSITRRKIENIDHGLSSFFDLELSELTEKEQIDLNILQKEQRQAKLKEYLMQTRNAMVTSQLLTTYRNKVPGGNLAVFCVSNRLYWDERDKPRDVALPSLQLSGIPALRSHCLGIIADSHLSIAKSFIENDIPALLGEATLWVESGAGSARAEQKHQIRDTLNLIESRLKRDCGGRCRTRMASPFCRNFGNHHTSTAGWHDWNEEMIHTMVRDVTPQWDIMCTSCRERLGQISRLIKGHMEWALDLLGKDVSTRYWARFAKFPSENELGTFPGVTDLLQEILICYENTMNSQVEALIDRLGTDLNTLRINALTGIRTSMLGQAMEAPYKKCNADYGGGSDRRRKNIIRSAVDRVDLFENHMTEFKRRMRLLADHVQTELRAIVHGGLTAVVAVLNLIRDENVATESEENPALRRRLEQEITVIKEQMGRIINIME